MRGRRKEVYQTGVRVCAYACGWVVVGVRVSYLRRVALTGSEWMDD